MEGEDLRRNDAPVRSYCDHRHDRIGLSRNRWYRHGAILSNTENTQRGIGASRVAPGSSGPRGVARRSRQVKRLRKSNTKSRDNHTLHGVLAIVDDGKPCADYCFARAKERPAQPRLVRGCPRKCNTRCDITVVHIENPTVSGINGHEPKRWVKDLTVCGRIFPRLEKLLSGNRIARARIDLDGLAAEPLDGSRLPTIANTER